MTLPDGWAWKRRYNTAQRADGASVVQRMGNMAWWYSYQANVAEPIQERGKPIRSHSALAAIAVLEGKCPMKPT